MLNYNYFNNSLNSMLMLKDKELSSNNAIAIKYKIVKYYQKDKAIN